MKNYLLIAIFIIFAAMTKPEECYAQNRAAWMNAIGQSMQQYGRDTGNSSTEDTGAQIADDGRQLQQSENCQDQCINDFHTRAAQGQIAAAQGHTIRCKDEPVCRQCLSSCGQ